MPRLTHEELVSLTEAMAAQDFLRRVRTEIEALHRVVFHAGESTEWDRVRRSAEQILIAELVYRHRSQPEGVYLALRALEDSGQTWEAAIQQLASAIHSYYTTPLGVLLRQDLFGADAVFILPDAYDWPARFGNGAAPGQELQP